ncbi:MAG: VanW family protein [Candidatus Levybacteria bacterium]|nr:VanW family protein [Candidatus Levybacteria bacterium]
MKKESISDFIDKEKKKVLKAVGKSFFWFIVGITLGSFFFLSSAFVIFQRSYSDVIYPGVTINGINSGGKKQNEIKMFFAKKNEKIQDTKFVFTTEDKNITTTAKELDFGYNEDLLAQQAYSLGRSDNLFSNMTIVLQAYLNGVNLPPSYRYSEEKLKTALSPIAEKVNISAVEALFNFQNGRVSAFRPSSEGQEVDFEAVKKNLESKTLTVVSAQKPQTIIIPIPIRVIKPKATTDKANSLGIKEQIATGTSLFQHSIPGRIFNVTLASTRLNGVLIAPGEVFSFNNALGDVSSFTGYQQAYIIQNGRTILGDGGGVCQVSTTLFRAALNAGLPIVERHAHAYRVGYYEQDSGPGLDATVYGPTVDLKFKNDTGHYILIQTSIDPSVERLTFTLYGTKDGRQTIIDKPVIISQTAPPPVVYQDDPTLPKGVLKQVDFEAWGANVYFTRKVLKDGKTIISDKFTSNFQPWAAVYLRGTKE